MNKVPKNTQVLDRELLFEFLGGTLVIDNPSCRQLGVIEGFSLDETNGKVDSIGVLFSSIVQLDLVGRPMPTTEIADYGMSLELKPDEAIVNGNTLTVPTKFKKETLILTRLAA